MTCNNPIQSRRLCRARLEDVERQRILEALQETGAVIGGQHGAAARLGLKRTTLLSKMQKLGIARNTNYTPLTRKRHLKISPSR